MADNIFLDFRLFTLWVPQCAQFGIPLKLTLSRSKKKKNFFFLLSGKNGRGQNRQNLSYRKFQADCVFLWKVILKNVWGRVFLPPGMNRVNKCQ